MARFFYGCNISFRTAESKYFKDFVRGLRPAYTPASRKQLGSKLLDRTHDVIEKQKIEIAIKMDKQAVLLIDGWQNSAANKHLIVTMLATSNGPSVILEAFDFSTTREFSVNLFEAANKSIALAKERYDVAVYACISDNANNMTCMGHMLNLM